MAAATLVFGGSRWIGAFCLGTSKKVCCLRREERVGRCVAGAAVATDWDAGRSVAAICPPNGGVLHGGLQVARGGGHEWRAAIDGRSARLLYWPYSSVGSR